MKNNATAVILLMMASSLFGQSRLMSAPRTRRPATTVTTTTSAVACTSAPYCSVAVNITWDSAGYSSAGVTPGTWGNEDSVDTPIAFSQVPTGYRVRIMRIYGDGIAFAHGQVVAGSHAGLLFGVIKSGNPDLTVMSPQIGNDTSIMYHQGAVAGGTFTETFDHDTSAAGLLLADNTLYLRMAFFDCDLGQALHMEVTTTMVYRFEYVGQ